jgi:predicted RND superfamily exporter protein
MSFKIAKFIVALAIVVFGVVLANIFPLLQFNNDHWLPNTNAYQQDLNYLEKEFQPGFGSLIVLKFSDPYFSDNNINFLRKLTHDIESINTIFKLNSPLDATTIINQNDMLTIQTYDDALTEGTIASINDYTTMFKTSPYYGKLLSTDHQWVGISVSIEKKNDNNDLHRRVSAIESIKTVLARCPQSIKSFVSGDAAIYYEMDKSTQQNLTLLLPLAFFLLLFIASLFLKQWQSVLIIIIPTLINLGLVPIFIILLGHYITIINVTLFILVLVITVADGIHMLNYWEQFTLKKSPQAIADTIRATWLPCFITSITTAVGFGSFASSTIIPLNEYGIQSFLVMLFSYFIVMTMVPLLLRAIPPKITSSKDTELFPSAVKKWTTFIENNSKKIVLSAILITIFFSLALFKSKTETSFISVFFNNNHPVKQQVQLIDQHLTGSGRLDVLIQSEAPNTFKSIAAFEELQNHLKLSLKHPLIQGSNDISVPIKLIHKGFNTTSTNVPTTNEELDQELLFLEFSRGDNKTDVLSSVVDFNYQNTRIEFITHQLTSSKIKTVVEFLEQTFLSFDGMKISITGSQFLSYILGKYILKTQVITIMITLFFIWILFISLYGIKLGSLGMCPNIIPMMLTLSLLPMTNTSFDFATVLISSVTLGLCVDDTIHWLHHFQRLKKTNIPNPAIQTSKNMFKPLFLSSVILCSGFGILGFADLVILKKFGLFTSVAIILAFLSDIVLLPATIRSFKLTK